MLLSHPDVDDDSVKLGLLTFKAVVRGANYQKVAALMQCDCGRYITIPTSILRLYGSNEALADLPWSCEECEYTKPTARGYRPWRPNYPINRRTPVPEELRLPTCSKSLHPKEWFAWQQAKRISKGVVSRWEEFKWFYKDMGDSPHGGSLAKRNAKKPHGPANSYWRKPVNLTWGEQVVSGVWLREQHGVPERYTRLCRKVGMLDARWIQARYHQGLPPPKRGEDYTFPTLPQFID